MKILIVDDEINIANGIMNIIKNQTTIPYKVSVTDNGSQALEIGKTLKPDLLITDIVMPSISGLDLIEAFKENHLCQHYIVLSGHDKFDYAQSALRFGAMDYLLKPVDKYRLLSQCEKIYNSLPNIYAQKKHHILPDISYFKWDLSDSQYPPSLKRIIAYIDKNYMNDISLNDLSQELFLHSSYISSLINKHCGNSFTYLLDYVRLGKVAELLLYEDNISISEISYLVGYNNERRLYHAFQKRLNCTPGDFKNTYYQY